MGQDLPPSFDGELFTYGFAIFSLSVMVLTALGGLMSVVIDFRRSCWRRGDLSEAYLAMRAGTGFLAVWLLLGTLPDVVWMLTWGEVSLAASRWLLVLDRLCDGVSLFPFVLGLGLWIWASPSAVQAVAERGRLPRLGWRRIWPWVRIFLGVATLATGVTVGKAWA